MKRFDLTFDSQTSNLNESLTVSRLHELEAFLASKGQDTHAEHLFKVLDKDGSTDLSFDEFSGIGHVAAEILGSIF